MRGVGELAGSRGWMKYVIASVLIHGAVLSIPAIMRTPRSVEPIEIFVIGGDNPPLAGGGMQGGKAKNMTHQGGSPPAAHKQTHVEARKPLVRAAVPMEKPAPAQSTFVPHTELAAPTTTATPQEPGTGVAVASDGSGSRQAGFGIGQGVGGSGAGSGGIGPGGSGNGSGGGSGSGNGSGIGAGFGAPGGPRFLHREIPEYPFVARRHNKEGSVLLMVTLDTAGKLIKAEIVEASDQVFVNPSLEAVKKSTFLPAEKDGRPVACKVLLPIRFSLTE